ncbi:uncharacterized protein N7515_007476 [Penicillium bovifimosum]|uniref:HNH nuclease domain-containing protein n=1 Tax=Penicillium bovifimosum TaxID=126998 RepID=A0A9W9GWQ3_9EURO|nr:uncharacterized protein N7515_007476 [Penicillium bovifimosum]KAJ5131437.1 hypothetical protein N7515_007476 [Penicillium bovifimosum]
MLPAAGAQAIPGGQSGMPGNEMRIPGFWKYVDVFWGHATAERWEKAVFNNPNDPEAPVNDCTNMICLRKDLRAAWLDALFALRPVSLSNDKTEMVIESYWQPQYTHRPFETIPITTAALSSESSIGVIGMAVMVGEGDQRRPIESGYRFKMTTHTATGIRDTSRKVLW